METDWRLYETNQCERGVAVAQRISPALELQVGKDPAHDQDGIKGRTRRDTR